MCKILQPSRKNICNKVRVQVNLLTQPAFACLKSTIETPEQCVKYVQSQQ